MKADFIPALALAALLSSTSSCKANDETVLRKDLGSKKLLVTAEKKATYTVAKLRNKYALGIAETLIKYPVSTYRITYLTKDLKGNEVTASGAIMVPEGTDSFAFLNYNHGTIFPGDSWSVPS